MTEATLKLIDLARSFGPNTLALSNIVLANPDFDTWTGSGFSFIHHYGKGQLAQHTLEVAELCLKNNAYFMTLGKGVNDCQLFLAALFHDIGKLQDYMPVTPEPWPNDIENTTELLEKWESNLKHKEQIYHISRSGIVWSKAFDRFGDYLPPEAHDNVLHAILAHHGRLEWKSPVTPRTRMAWLLHLSDNMSARMDDCEKKRPPHKS